MASSGSPCAACKFLRRKCTSECVFAPYFPPDQPQKFANVHKIFGASNISKLLNELPPHQREDAVNSLAYEADARVKDPVYGCVGAISILQQRVSQLQNDLVVARSDLARYAGAGIVQVASPTSVAAQQVSSLGIGMGLPGVRTRDQMFSREQLVDLSREQHLGGARQSYESLAHQRVTGPFLPQLASFPHERHGPGLGNDVGGPSGSGAGGQMGHFSSDPRS